jgi:uncharacterized protein YkwD
MRLALLTLVLAACGPKDPSTTTTPSGGGSGDDESWSEEGPPDDEADPGRAGNSVGGVNGTILDEHNRYRAEHCAPPLAWSDKLAGVAQDWANQMRDNGCDFNHSKNPYGENLAGGTSGALPPEDVVEMWYREVDGYDFRGGGFSMETGHFTQLVWKATTHVGCGMSQCGGMDYWVCNYEPYGNVEGGYQANVLPTSCK